MAIEFSDDYLYCDTHDDFIFNFTKFLLDLKIISYETYDRFDSGYPMERAYWNRLKDRYPRTIDED